MTIKRENYPRAEGHALDALVANMGIKRFVCESDDELRQRVVDYVRDQSVNAGRFLGEIPPRWVIERSCDGGYSYRSDGSYRFDGGPDGHD